MHIRATALLEQNVWIRQLFYYHEHTVLRKETVLTFSMHVEILQGDEASHHVHTVKENENKKAHRA